MDKYFVEGKYRNMTVTIHTTSYAAAVRGAHQILAVNDGIQTVAIKDRKGEIIKVVKR